MKLNTNNQFKLSFLHICNHGKNLDEVIQRKQKWIKQRAILDFEEQNLRNRKFIDNEKFYFRGNEYRLSLIFGSEDPHNGYGPNSFMRLVKSNKNIKKRTNTKHTTMISKANLFVGTLKHYKNYRW